VAAGEGLRAALAVLVLIVNQGVIHVNLRTTRWLKLLIPLLALSMVAAACGGNGSDDNADSGGGGNAGKPPAPTAGFDGTTIRLGVISPQTGLAAALGKPLTNGNDVFFKALNAKGGIAGKYKVTLDVRDSQYASQTAIQQYNASKGNVAAYVQILGTNIVQAMLPLLRSDNIVAGPATLDSLWIPEQQLMALGAPYQVQAVNAMDWWINQEGHKDSKVCLLRQDDPYGEAGKEGLAFAADQLDFKIVKEAVYGVTDTDWSAQVNQLKAAGCEVVHLVGLPNATIGIMTVAAQTGFEPQWIGQGPNWIGLLKDIPYVQKHLAIVTEGPQWGDGSPGMTQMLADAKQFSPEQQPDIYFLFGYAQAWSMAQVLEKAVANGDLSRKGITEAMNTVGTLETGGLLGDYQYGKPSDRVFPRAGRIYTVDPATPGGLKGATDLFTSDAAKKFKLK
jgi:ABC-type branched-subunit amino acid transport system substrate-binding protein